MSKDNLSGIDKFKTLFVIILTDNGSEFSNPIKIGFNIKIKEFNIKLFYCHPASPFEKGSCKVNQKFLRKFFQKLLLLLI